MPPSPQAPSATGGSADSQADSLDARTWQPRRGLSAAVRITTFAIPAVASFVTVWAAMALIPPPASLLVRLPWLALLVVVSLASMKIANFGTRRLAPLGALFKMSLVFPDAAPSRFQTALRAQSGRQLRREAVEKFPTHQAAAEHLAALLARLTAHDRLTRGHSERVRAYSVLLGEEIDLSSEALIRLNWAALAHDVGKLEVPSEILNKNGRPTEEEWRTLKNHPAAAEEYVAALRPWLGDWVDCATQHHERYDGTGYPSGLAGNRISLAGRIVSIADAFDVMTAARSYKKPLPAAQARAELLRNAETQFDPSLVRSFLQISLPQERWVSGWLGWFTNLPSMFRLPVVPAMHSVGGAVAAATVAAVAVVTAPISTAPSEQDFAAERAVAEAGVPGPSPTAPIDIDTGASASSPSTATSTVATPTSTTTASSLPDGATPPTAAAPTSTAPTNSPNPPTTTAPPGTTTTTATATPTTTAAATTTTSTTSTTTTTAPPAITVANNDTAPVLVVVGGTIRVLDNDTFGSSSANSSSLAIVSPPSRGLATVVGATIRYTPGALVTNGTDTFTYRICSVAGSCDTATVVVTIGL